MILLMFDSPERAKYVSPMEWNRIDETLLFMEHSDKQNKIFKEIKWN